ncbi:sugar kinase [Tabrizicola sp. J26]|uniref:sugar kinase n=1 Tax=Alitabrizicola rongguiensis TaxID=2909234 RepID=UPI001F2DFB29|nr:sugar kinase [Tabrizicola rongguiensis]MCF1709393.1 sugar kinase [Tabrizicola rongguiensis]
MQVISIGECMVELQQSDNGLWRQGFAGDTMNVAWAMRALLSSEWQVHYLTMIGTDRISDQMLDFIASAGIETRQIARHPKLIPGLYTIANDATGERFFTYWRSSSAARHLADDPEWIAGAVSSAGLVYLSGITLAILEPDRRKALIEVLGQRDDRPFRVAMDPNIRSRLWENATVMRETITAAASVCDILLPTFDDEAAGFGDKTPEVTLKRYYALGAGEVIVKNGTHPTLFHEKCLEGAVPVQPSASVVDTTGAGDSFNGAYLAARLRGERIRDAVRKAQSVAGRVVQQRGALCDMQQLRNAYSDGC